MDGMVTVTINGETTQVPEHFTILEAAESMGVRIPTLCHLNLHDLHALNQVGVCRVCLVEVEGSRSLVTSCCTAVTEGMKINTHTPDAVMARRTTVELLLSNHPFTCLTCDKNRNCELQKLAADLGIQEDLPYTGKLSLHPKDLSSKAIKRDPDKCVLCRRCETMCNKVQTCGIISAMNRGFGTTVGPAFERKLVDTMCTFCGQCVAVCPTGALTAISNVREVWDAINDPDKFVVVQTAPAVRVALGEEFGMEPGTIVTGKMVTLLRKLGFDRVFDTDFAADLTIMEEASELIHRVQHGGTLPILTSCCPAWVKFFEHQFPDLLDIPSTCKSPHEMFGAVVKTFYAKKIGVDPKKMVVVSVMPCLAKKYEATREELNNDGLQNVDYVITTRELGLMARESGLNLAIMPDGDFDNPLGESTGASVIFGTTGGVIEAALRTAYEWLTNKPLENVEFTQLRGFGEIREAKVNIEGKDFTIGVAHGLGNARHMLEAIQSGEKHYDAIEIMACPGGCVGGGGQPYHHGDGTIIKKRAAAIYREDAGKKKRKSHENEDVLRIYDEYIGEVYGERAHELLHTHYKIRERY